MEAGAELSDCGHYRYLLWREWDVWPPLGWIMLNPSTADAREDDPTIRRCIGFAKRDGYGGIRVVNLYSFRATNPKMLARAVDPIGKDGDPWGWLQPGVRVSDVVLAWGSVSKEATRRARNVLSRSEANVRLFCLGTTRNGQPRHPLYIAGDTPLRPYSVNQEV